MFIKKINYSYLFLFFYICLFSLVLIVIYKFGSKVPYYSKNITDAYTFLDGPSFKNVSIFNDLSISIIIFLSIFIFIGKKFGDKINKHLQFIWSIKCFFSFFGIIIFEYYTGLDQTTYFFSVINSNEYLYHFGNLEKLIDLENPTVNFLLSLKIVNFIFNDSWFIQKIFQNLLYFSVIILSYKTIINLNYNFKNNITVIYFISFLPSLFFFSSFITKDLIILSAISITIYSCLSFKIYESKNFILNTILVLITLSFIYLLRWWVSTALILSIILFLLLIFLDKYSNNNGILIFTLLAISSIFIINYSEIWKENSPEIFYELFNRFSVEHFYPPNAYDTLFINAGEKLEVLKLLPEALFKVLFNPFFDKLFTLKLFLFSLENIFIFILSLLAITNAEKHQTRKIYLVIFFVMISTFMYSVVGYLNTGTTMRYALQAKLPLIIIIVTLNHRLFDKLNNFLIIIFSKIQKYKVQ